MKLMLRMNDAILKKIASSVMILRRYSFYPA